MRIALDDVPTSPQRPKYEDQRTGATQVAQLAMSELLHPKQPGCGWLENDVLSVPSRTGLFAQGVCTLLRGGDSSTTRDTRPTTG